MLGAELLFKLLKEEQIAVSESVTLQNIVFGWVLAGRVNSTESTKNEHLMLHNHNKRWRRLKRSLTKVLGLRRSELKFDKKPNDDEM